MDMMNALNTLMAVEFLTDLQSAMRSNLMLHRVLILFKDIKYSKYDHEYWDNLELENDINRVILP